MAMILGILMGLQLLGPEVANKIDESLEKVCKLYGNRDVLPYIKLLSQKMDFFVNLRLLSAQDMNQFIMAEALQLEA